MVEVAVLRYGVGNIYSVRAGLERAGAKPRIIESLRDALSASALVLPGVGAYPAAMKRLRGEEELLHKLIVEGVPVLGICLGMQLFFEASTEWGYTRGLGLLEGIVEELRARKKPHIGWARTRVVGESTLLEGLPGEFYAYYIHSYAVPYKGQKWAKAVSGHDGTVFAAVVEEHPIYGTQFHPERSGLHGERVLRNFVAAAKR